MLEFFRKRKLNKAFGKYIHELGPALVKRYGTLKQFTVLQIKSTIEILELDSRFIAYAVALYRKDASENTVKLLRVNQEDIDNLRVEIANAMFHGNMNYTIKDVLELSKKEEWRGGSPPSWVANKGGQTSL